MTAAAASVLREGVLCQRSYTWGRGLIKGVQCRREVLKHRYNAK